MTKPLPDPRAKPDETAKEWLARIRATERGDFKTWLDDAEEAERIFLAESTGEGVDAKLAFDFNILHSNIETTVPSIYNSTPVPDIRERFKTGPTDPNTAVARTVAQMHERVIQVMIDDGALDVEAEVAVQDAIMAGRGVVRVRFDAEVMQPPMDPTTGQPVADPMTGQPAQPTVTGEKVLYEVVSWRDYREGPAKRWRDVPWVAFRYCLDPETVEEMQDEELRTTLAGGSAETDSEGDAESNDVLIWEIWDKRTKSVYIVSESSGKLLKVIPDPLQLRGFFPCIRPMQPIQASSKRTPVVPYKVYKGLAAELEAVTKRIKKLIGVLKARGFFAGQADMMQALSEADDGQLIPIPDLEALAQTGGLDSAISWWPLEAIIKTLKELYVQREQVKQTIYEVTGISDIIRGASDAQETATAQQIKTQWGTLRVNKLKRMVERAMRELFCLTAEIVSTKFSPQTIVAISGMQLPPGAETLFGKPLDYYRIDVETDSTTRADQQPKREEMKAFLEGAGAYFSTMAPIMQQSPMMAGPLIEMFAAFARSFNLGKQAEDALEQMVQMAAQAAQQAQANAQAGNAQGEGVTPVDEAKARNLDAQTRQTDTETALMGGPIAPGQAPTQEQALMAGAQGEGPLAQAMAPPVGGQGGPPPGAR